MSTNIDIYFAKAKRWRAESERLRAILLESGLEEALKWGKPCYSSGSKNIAIIQKMNDFVALMFFDGLLLKDPKGLLQSQCENTHAARRLTFTSEAEVEKAAKAVRDFVRQAVAAHESGVKVPKRTTPLELVDELEKRLAADRKLRTAFEALTPGRQREYNLHIGGAKQAKTRESRIDACAPKILAGKGFRDA